MGVRLLLYGDLHLGPGGREYAFERPDLDGLGVDVVVSVGDVVDDNVDRSGRDARPYERRGRAFFEHLDGQGVPVVAVPGNHDPLAVTERLTEGLSNVVVAHERVLEAGDLPGGPDLDGCSLVGIGCEEFDVSMTLPYASYATIDPRTNATTGTIAYVADDAADQVEAAVGDYLSGEHGVDGVADDLGIEGSARERLAAHLDDLVAEFRDHRSLLAAAGGEAVLLSHVSPFNTEFDFHHASDGVDGRVHRGSIPLKMATAAAAPLATLCGHSHEEDHDVLETVRGGRVAYNPGSPGVAVVDVDREARTVDVTRNPF